MLVLFLCVTIAPRSLRCELCIWIAGSWRSAKLVCDAWFCKISVRPGLWSRSRSTLIKDSLSWPLGAKQAPAPKRKSLSQWSAPKCSGA